MSDFLSNRLPFAWLRERDVDLLLCSELHARGNVAELLASKVGDAGAAVIGAWVSHAEIDGESDLVVELLGARGRTIALIENKVSAHFQPEQGARYRARASRASDAGLRAVTVLVAPAGYLERNECQQFDVRIAYEEIAAAAEAAEDQRSVFFANALIGAIESYRRGYVAHPDAEVSGWWTACWQIASRETPRLRLQEPGPKPGRSTWIYFRDAEGFERGCGAVVVYKAERGQADLQFAGTSAAELAGRVQSALRPDMRVVPAAKSASIRLAVPAIDFNSSSSEQGPQICAGLQACEQLRALYADRLKLVKAATQ